MTGCGAAEVGAGDAARESTFLGTCTLLFIASACATIDWCGSMSGGMPMPGGWTMSMAWMRMPGQTWLGAAATFMGMWVVMMVAMMLPSLVPMLLRYRDAVRVSDEPRLAGMTALAGAGYFFAWASIGALVYPLGVAVAAAEMQWPALARCVPIATGVVLLLAGGVQLTAWKAHQLACCRGACADEWSLPDAGSAWRHGRRLGAHCSSCCTGFMMILLVSGVMDLGAMALIAAAITAERFAPRPERAARAAGVVAIALGILDIGRGVGLA